MKYFYKIPSIALGIYLLASIFIVSSERATSAIIELQPHKIHKYSAPSKFEIAMKTVIRHEGGLTNNKSDPGGITNYGISLRFIKGAYIDIDGDGDSDKDDILKLTQTDADKIYYKDWYIKYHYDRIISQTILTDILDFSINAGASQCHKLVKRAIDDIMYQKIEINGILDNTTINLINALPESEFHAALNKQQVDFYKSIVKRNPSMKVFLPGWIKRANE